MDDTRIIRTLRTMAWERAKGEMRAMLQTFWSGHEHYEELSSLIEDFIKKVEDDGLQE